MVLRSEAAALCVASTLGSMDDVAMFVPLLIGRLCDARQLLLGVAIGTSLPSHLATPLP
jgi:hypothetical protein